MLGDRVDGTEDVPEVDPLRLELVASGEVAHVRKQARHPVVRVLHPRQRQVDELLRAASLGDQLVEQRDVQRERLHRLRRSRCAVVAVRLPISAIFAAWISSSRISSRRCFLPMASATSFSSDRATGRPADQHRQDIDRDLAEDPGRGERFPGREAHPEGCGAPAREVQQREGRDPSRRDADLEDEACREQEQDEEPDRGC